MCSRRVVLLHPFDAFSGSQKVAAYLARALTDSGHKLELYLGFGSRGFVSDWPAVHRFLGLDHVLARKLLYPLWLIVMWPRMVLAAIRGDIVWANTVNSIAAAIPMVILAPQHLVIHAHEVEFASLTRHLMSWAERRGAQILGVSLLHVERLGVPAQVLSNCVDVRSDQDPGPIPTVIYVGMATALKGFPLFVDVVRCFKSDQVRWVAYVPSRSPAVESLLQQADDAGIELKIGCTNPLDIYPRASLLLQCTDASQWTETFSLVMVEALACGVPVATAGMAVACEVLGDAWAFDVANRDPRRIATKIENLLSSPERLEALRVAAKIRRELYTYERFRANVLSLVARVGTVEAAADQKP